VTWIEEPKLLARVELSVEPMGGPFALAGPPR